MPNIKLHGHLSATQAMGANRWAILYRAARQIGSLAAAFGGLAFTGGNRRARGQRLK
jgi:hypothetical protein